jgi:hypothetical protein
MDIIVRNYWNIVRLKVVDDWHVIVAENQMVDGDNAVNVNLCFVLSIWAI